MTTIPKDKFTSQKYHISNGMLGKIVDGILKKKNKNIQKQLLARFFQL